MLVNVSDTALYKEDWIGLRTLDEAGKLVRAEVSTLLWLPAGAALRVALLLRAPPIPVPVVYHEACWQDADRMYQANSMMSLQVPDARHMQFTAEWFQTNVIERYLKDK